MLDADLFALASRITEQGLLGRPETEIVTDTCAALCRHGLELAQVDVIIDTLHPTHEGHVFKWHEEKAATKPIEYGVTVGDRLERWRQSTFHHLLDTGDCLLRRRLSAETDAEFSILADHRAGGATDYVAIVNRFSEAGTIGDMDCVYSAWTTRSRDGFREEDVLTLARLMPFLAHAVKTVSLTKITATLAETYLGRDAGRRVLTGRINRGVADRIDTVLWFSDLRGFTHLAESIEPDQIIPLLNAYAEVVIAAIQSHAGDVLKLVGDGVLAIFPGGGPAEGCAAALGATAAARDGIAALNARRASEGLPTAELYLGLHVGEVFYGNVGSADRLDFTVIGPAVNEVSRIAALCRSADQGVLVSSAFKATVQERTARFASVGRYALRGVGRAQDLDRKSVV